MKRFIVCAASLLAAAATHAEQLYVIDKLVVGVYPEMESEDGKLANLETGDSVEALERQDKYVRIRLEDGREGWVKANYLTAQPPAIVRLKELQASAAAPSPQLTQELAQTKEQNATLLKEVASLKQAAAEAAATAAAAAPEPIAPPPATETEAAEPRAAHVDTLESSTPIWLWPLVILASGAVGFGAGYQAFARRIRRKYGSVRII